MTSALQRKLRLRNGSSNADVVIRIAWPEQRENSWFSDWTIHWPDRERKGSAGGADAIQALLVALKIVGAELYCSAEHESGRLIWADDWSGYGFPVPANIRDLLIGDDAAHF